MLKLKWPLLGIRDPGRKPSPRQATDAVEQARALVQDGSFAAAESLLREALRRKPAAAIARSLGALCAMQERFDEAFEALRVAIEIDPADAMTANLIGVCHSLTGNYEEAAAYYELALRSDPSLFEAYSNAGWNGGYLGTPERGDWFREWLLRPQPDAPAPPVPDEKSGLDAVTLCCIDCAYHELAADALRFSLAQCSFGDALFLSDRDCAVEGVRWVGIDPLRSVADYSNFVIHRLHEHIRTEYVLIVQYDGFVLNAAAWDPAYLEYDYVGATMPLNGKNVVGNGGFCLRSAKLLRALRDDDEIRRYDASRGSAAEDIAISDTYRTRLESAHGIRFAPEALADRFSAGLTLPTARNFGFHGLYQLVCLRDNGFRLPEGDDGTLRFSFRAPTDLGMLMVTREAAASARGI